MDHELLERLAIKIQSEWGMGGLYEGIYRDFFLELFTRYLSTKQGDEPYATSAATEEEKAFYEGLFTDTTLECVASSEEEAQQIMKKMLIKQIMADNEPVIVWFVAYCPPNKAINPTPDPGPLEQSEQTK